MNKYILVIVESPKKCMPIEKYLNSIDPKIKYKVVASFGHICELGKGLECIDIQNNYKPSYIITKKDVFGKIKLLANSKQCQEVIIATDLDREGEAIAYHLMNKLKLNINTTKRIIFNQITKKSLEEAIKNPTTLNIYLVNAYQARIILDKYVGYMISPVLWQYIENKLSAGRCQSPALMLLYDRNNEKIEFTKETFYNVNTIFGEHKLVGTLNKKLKNEDDIKSILKAINKSTGYINNIKTRESKNSPSAPYITSSLQQDASNLLGMSPDQCMKNAQGLYEKGKITYMRTDFPDMSEDAKEEAKDIIVEKYGQTYYTYRTYKSKSKNTQEAHECIRPIDFTISDLSEDSEISSYESRLYKMIYSQAIMSQMSDKLTNVLKIEIKLSKKKELNNDYLFIASFEQIKFPGYTIVRGGKTDSQDEILEIMENIKKGTEHDCIKTTITQDFTNPKTNYTQASLIKELEKLGIGRPSTFASIMKTLVSRGYASIQSIPGEIIKYIQIVLEDKKVIKTELTKTTNNEKNKLVISELGITVCHFLIKHFSELIMNYEYTNNIEKELDKIAGGDLVWHRLVHETYCTFEPIVKQLKSTKEGGANKKCNELGEVQGRNLKAYIGPYGPVLQWGVDDDKIYINIPFKVNNIQTLTFDQVESLLPVIVGTFENEKIVIKSGQWGKYFKFKGTNYPIGDDNDFTLEKAITLINAKGEEKQFGIYKIKTGKFGMYVTDGKTNASISKKYNIEDFDENVCRELIKNKKKFSKKKYDKN